MPKNVDYFLRQKKRNCLSKKFNYTSGKEYNRDFKTSFFIMGPLFKKAVHEYKKRPAAPYPSFGDAHPRCSRAEVAAELLVGTKHSTNSLD